MGRGMEPTGPPSEGTFSALNDKFVLPGCVPSNNAPPNLKKMGRMHVYQ